MATPTPPTATPTPSPWPTVGAAVALLTAAISVLLVAFAWPSVHSTVHNVPIAVAGPPAATERVTTELQKHAPHAFDITPVTDTAAADQLIRDRTVYGAIDVSTGTPQVITASAASASIAQSLQGVATALAQTQAPEAHPAVAVRDIVALPADDPRGAGLTAGALPLVIGGMLAAALLATLIRGTARRVTGALAFATTGGLAMAAILQFWLGSLDGAYLANAGAIALTIAAISLTVLGLKSLLGTVGIGIGGATMMLIGNPLAGTTTAPQMLPGWSGTLGQLLPPGAGGQLLRSTAYFDGAGATHSVAVLLSWLTLGVVLGLAGTRRTATTATTVDDALPTATAAA